MTKSAVGCQILDRQNRQLIQNLEVVPKVWTPASVERVRQAVIQSPERSAQKRAAALEMSSRHQDQFHPYKLMIVQQLNEENLAQRQQFVERIRIMFADENEPVIIMSNAAHFYVSSSVNKQNYRYWAAQDPREPHQRILCSEKVTVWQPSWSEWTLFLKMQEGQL